MAVYTDLTLPGIMNTDADFRSWGTKVAAGIVAAGLVQTADTGQINWATVLKPTLANTVAGYEIYRFNDTLQATAPIFIKVEYGSGGGATTPALWVTVGTSTNGAGTVNNSIISTRKQLDATTTSATSLQLLCSGGTGWFTLVVVNPATSSSFSVLFTVDRTKDVTGADTADGVCTICSSAATGYQYHLLPFGGAALPTAVTTPPYIFPSVGGLSIFGLDVGMSPPILFIGKVVYGTSLMAYTSADLQGMVAVVASVLGANHTYLPLGANFNSVTVSGGSGSLAIRWE
jgi:hypothetical protein